MAITEIAIRYSMSMWVRQHDEEAPLPMPGGAAYALHYSGCPAAVVPTPLSTTAWLDAASWGRDTVAQRQRGSSGLATRPLSMDALEAASALGRGDPRRVVRCSSFCTSWRPHRASPEMRPVPMTSVRGTLAAFVASGSDRCAPPHASWAH